MGEAIVFTSGKGGVGKTTTIANIGAGLSRLDKKVVMLDTDMGLRNLDVVMGMEDQIQYNLMDLLENQCRFKQALIRDKRYSNLFMIPAALRYKPVKEFESKLKTLIGQLKKEFDYCLIDCPAGIEDGFHFAVSSADRAIIVTTPHISAVRDASRVILLLENMGIRRVDMIINEYNEKMVKKHDMLSKSDIEEVLGVNCLGVVPVDDKVIISQNQGIPVMAYRSKAARSLMRIVREVDNPRVIPVNLDNEDTIHRQGRIFISDKECGYEG